MLTWLPQLSGIHGSVIKSPVTGMVMPLTEHPDLLYNSNVLTLALCIKLQHGTLKAPFSGVFDRQLLGGRRLRFKHNSGLVIQLDIPLDADMTNGKSVNHLVKSGATIRSGESVMSLDIRAYGNCHVVLMILPHPAITHAFSARRHVEALNDAALIIQTGNKPKT
ncbi:PTS glucose transporter subunit IIA [Rheinheimera maricola]|uniref:PTS glucose transporter subunit IIA n=1 Tax=Rheinheimera maricola TaxID=2793282 RepID=A0ABS7XDE2_9GAMM|nr:PTS glucose transporter subunit IIA [Rheinheimera maricola]MBZ9613561.1 PTS glucose transporter subunit IIA [Rheinheimera maricola]